MYPTWTFSALTTRLLTLGERISVMPILQHSVKLNLLTQSILILWSLKVPRSNWSVHAVPGSAHSRKTPIHGVYLQWRL